MKKKSIKINIIFNAFLKISSLLFPLITFPYVSRMLGSAGMGRVTFANSFVAYLLLIAQMGIPTYGIRACAKARDDKAKLSKVVYELLLIEILLTIIAVVIMIVLTNNIPKLVDNKSVIYIIGLSLLLNLFGVEWLYQALEEYKYITVRSLIFKVLALALMFFIITGENDIEQYAFLVVLASSGSYICNIFYLRKYIYSPLYIQGRLEIFKHVKSVLVFFGMTMATTIYTNIDNLMLGFLSSDNEVGYYTAATKVKSFSVSLLSSVGIVILPRTTQAIEREDKKEVKRLFDYSINLVVAISVLMIGIFYTYAPQVIMVLSGEDYLTAVVPMRILMPTIMLIGITNVIGYQILIPMLEEKKMLYSVLIGAGVDLVINWMLVSQLLSTGVAIGTLTAEIVVFLVQYYILKKRCKMDLPINSMIRCIIIGLILFAALNMINSLITVTYIYMVISSFLYAVLYFFILYKSGNIIVVYIVNNLKDKMEGMSI